MSQNVGKKNQETKKEENTGIKGSGFKEWFRELWKQGADRKLELLLSLAIVIFASAQLAVTIINNIGTSHQVGKIIKAADSIKTSAGEFSKAAQRIETAGQSAVGKLQDQVKKMDEARKSADTDAQNALKATIDNFHRDQRAWLNVTAPQGFPTANKPYQLRMLIHNSGRTPAKHVVIKFNTLYLGKGTIPTFPFWGTPVDLGSVAPNQNLQFSYFGSGFEMDISGNQGNILYAYGTATYDDAFGYPHWTTYCFYTYRPDTWAYCKVHNDIGNGKKPSRK